MYILLLTLSLIAGADECVRVSLPSPENFEVSLLPRFFSAALDTGVPAGLATGNWFVAPEGGLCQEPDARLTLFNGDAREEVELTTPDEICVFVADVRRRMREVGGLRLSLFGQRRDEFMFGRRIGSRIVAQRACAFPL